MHPYVFLQSGENLATVEKGRCKNDGLILFQIWEIYENNNKTKRIGVYQFNFRLDISYISIENQVLC